MVARVHQRAAVSAFRTGPNYYATANPGGPAGSSLMTFFCAFTPKRVLAGTNARLLFARSNLGGNGWLIGWVNGIGFTALVYNGAGSSPIVPGFAIAPSHVGVPWIYTATYNNGTLQGWLNTTSQGSQTVGTGFTAYSAATGIGGGTNFGGTLFADDFAIHECGMLDGYNITASATTVIGQWREDLRQGRYFTWPRAMTTSDWYWSARDAVAGQTVASTWTDRGGNAAAMLRNGSPQGVTYPMRVG